MRSHTSPNLTGRCRRCFLPTRYCLCDAVPRVETRARFVIVRHAREIWKSTNTGRLAALALSHCELRTYGGPDSALSLEDLARAGSWLLFPGSPEGDAGITEARQIVVLDGTWHEARHMLNRLKPLAGLPRLSLAAPAIGINRLRRSPFPAAMSTLEAIGRAVALLEGEAVAAPLATLHAMIVERVLATRGKFPATSASRRSSLPVL